MEIETKETIYPGWKNAQEIILKLFELGELSYGDVIKNEKMMKWFDLKEPNTGFNNYVEYSSFRSKFYNYVESLKKSLVLNHQLCISNEKDTGYKLLSPDDQIKIEAQKYRQKSFNNLEREISLLSNVKHALLSNEAKKIRDREIAYIAFATRGLPNKQINKKIEG